MKDLLYLLNDLAMLRICRHYNHERLLDKSRAVVILVLHTHH